MLISIIFINVKTAHIADTEIVIDKHKIVSLKLDHFECDFSNDVLSIIIHQ
jgi:hypothetical protein